MDTKNNDCRFCLKKMKLNDRMAMIDDEISEQFSNITNMQLHFSTEYSQMICEICLRSLQLASAVKDQFIKNQTILYAIKNIGHESEESLPEMTPEPPYKRRKRNTKQSRNNDDFVDPLQLVSVQPFDEYENDSTSENLDNQLDLKQEPCVIGDNPALLEETTSPRRERKNIQVENVKIPELSQENRSYSLGDRKRFKCPHCDNVYKRKPHMLRHVEVSHMKVKYVCVVPGCSVHFVRKERLKKHIEMNHTELTVNEMENMIELVRTMKPVYGAELDDSNVQNDPEPRSSSPLNSLDIIQFQSGTLFKGLKLADVGPTAF